jgi:TatD DNase family protein
MMTENQNPTKPTYEYFDAHTHLPKDWPEFFSMLTVNSMAVAASISWPFELPAEALKSLEANRIFLTLGIHPWDADRADFLALEGIIKSSLRETSMSTFGQSKTTICALGEIGMDSLWCDVPLGLQRKLFLRQLDLAEETGLPVVLHTKGCEEEIAALIQPYSGPFLVHWYSAPTIFSGYLEKNCFFTVGPDAATNQAVQNIARLMALERLMVETDGLEAITWATGQKVTAPQIPAVLDRLIELIAAWRNLSTPDVGRFMVQNADTFYGLNNVGQQLKKAPVTTQSPLAD